ncbi:MAG TPA: hypothetical protein VFQ65_18275, partial [Kofleriaceae bacterium]|nr:hypothetical protein [Kofleriaceae bacterium]
MVKFVVAALCAARVAFADPHAAMKPGAYPDRVATWKKLAVQGVQLGTALASLVGFTCGPDPALTRHTCVRFLDERCKDKTTSIHRIRLAADVPAGSGCFMDEGSGATFLDRRYMQPPLSNVAV